ncbi:MAG TPA: DUF1003 domain-containing protein [Chryseolinea sp.]|nr:DUF1003 domain-containing protein [Chryseolinea sp.]HPH45810.1 DUF1003 domain-containing protein [Chryseolinea sp.]HPM29423.1 DUF1003 domain-containing protein [Chryseolinea sp.]
MKTEQCHITKQKLPLTQLVHGGSIREGLLKEIQKDHTDFKLNHYISIDELNLYRKKYVESILKEEVGELSHLEQEVVKSINENELLSENIESKIDADLKLGDRIADKIATFGGSWTFIISFFLFIIFWIIGNIYLLVASPFDPFPFILLNLLLSCLAAIQAPIIMMSQNRKETKDRQRSEHDYIINLKAELEIRQLHEKIDHMILQQNQHLLEIQQLQVDLMEDILTKLNHKDKHK